MPIQFCFVKPDGTNEDLKVVNEKIATECGVDSATDDSCFVNHVSDIGCNILERTNDSKVTIDSFSKYVTYLLKSNNSLYKRMCLHRDGKFMACLPKFLYQDYTFKAWR